MTTPPLVGFKDWQRTTHYAGQQKLTLTELIAEGNTYDTGAIYVGDYASIIVACNTLLHNGYYGVQIGWYEDQALTSQIVTSAFVTTNGGQLALTYPVITPWIKVEIVNYNDPSGQNFFLNMFATNASLPDPGTSQSTYPIITAHTSVGAGATDLIYATTLYRGPASFNVHKGTDGSWYASLDYWNKNTSSWFQLATMNDGGSSQQGNITVGVPATPLRVQVHNTGTSSRTFDVNVVAMAA